MSETILTFDNITKSFDEVQALNDVSCELIRGHTLGLIGENGAGKSTLMNILGGVVQPDRGSMTLDGQPYEPRHPRDATEAGIAFIHQELNLFSNLSIADNLFIDRFPSSPGMPLIDRDRLLERTEELLDQVGLSLAPNMRVERLSPGEQQLVEIAKALRLDARIIIFDEPTTSLTARESEKLFELIERFQESDTSIIYISHILSEVQRLSDDIVVLRNGEVVGKGPREEFDVDRMISLMVGRKLEELFPERSTRPSSEPALEVKGLSQPGLVKDINFTLHEKEILGVFGLMGSGRTEMARMIFGVDGFERGDIRVDEESVDHTTPRKSIRNKMAFITENRLEEGLLMNAPVLKNSSLVSMPRFTRPPFQYVDRQAMRREVEGIVQDLDIQTGDIARQPAKNLSGGNQQKTVVSKWLMSDLSLYIMDEPTRGIDVGAKQEVFNIMDELTAEGAAVLFICSEIDELLGICDRIMVMRNGTVRGTFERSEFDKERILREAFGEENGQ